MDPKEHTKNKSSSILSYYNTSSRLAAASSYKPSIIQASINETPKQVVATKVGSTSEHRLKKIEKSLGITKKVDKIVSIKSKDQQ